MRRTFQAQGVKGVVIACERCGENHFYEWELLQGEPRAHAADR